MSLYSCCGPIRSLAKLPAIEVEAAAPPRVAGCWGGGPVRPWGGVGDGRARHAAAVAAQHFGSSATLGDTTSISFLLARSAIGRANPSTSGLELLEQFRRRVVRYLDPVGPRRKVLDRLTQRGHLPVRVDRGKIAAEPVKLGLDCDSELPLIHSRRRS